MYREWWWWLGRCGTGKGDREAGGGGGRLGATGLCRGDIGGNG